MKNILKVILFSMCVGLQGGVVRAMDDAPVIDPARLEQAMSCVESYEEAVRTYDRAWTNKVGDPEMGLIRENLRRTKAKLRQDFSAQEITAAGKKTKAERDAQGAK